MMTKNFSNWTIEIEPVCFKPTDLDFQSTIGSERTDIAIQFGTDFHLMYNGEFPDKPKLGILQFVKSEVRVGDSPWDSSSNTELDKHRIYGTSGFKLEEYLFGNLQEKIEGMKSAVEGNLTANRCENYSEISDTPREYVSIKDGKLDRYPSIQFYDFVVAIKDGGTEVYSEGITWTQTLFQKSVDNHLLNDYELEITELRPFKITELNFELIFKDAHILEESYILK